VDHALDRRDRVLVALVHGPLLDALGAHQPGRDQDAHMFAEGRRADAEFFGNQQTTDAIFDQIAVNLRPEMLFRVGAGVALKIAHSGSEFSAIGRVVVRIADQTNRGVGVEFTDLASIDRARLEAYLADLVREEKLTSFAALRKKLGMRTGKTREAGDSANDEGTPKYPWQYAVKDAFKSPLDSLPGKIKVAEKAIAARLTDANHADIEEQLALKDALQGLRVLLAGTRPGQR